MSQQKITDEQWEAARKRYESEPGLGLGKIAQLLDCSKSLVARKAREGKWQKDIGVPNQVHPTGKAKDSKVTESAVPGPTQTVHVNPGGASTQPGRVVADVYVAPGAAKGVQTDWTPHQQNDYADEIRIPDGLDELDREAFVAAAIVARQRRINAKHIRELTAARAKLYGAIKSTATKDGPAQALASQRNIAALIALQAAEMDAELQHVKLDVAEFVGKPLKPPPCRIVAHLHPGEQLVPGKPLMTASEVYGRTATEVTDVISKDVQ